VNVRLSDAETAKAERLGNGNASAGLREALRRTRELQKTRTPTRQDVREWMSRHAGEFYSATALAEAAPVPAAWLDDETHWIWEEALEAFGFDAP
jgi:hypothetical protein